MEIEKSKVLIKFLLNFRQSGDVLFFLNIRRLRGYTATAINTKDFLRSTSSNLSSFKKVHKVLFHLVERSSVVEASHSMIIFIRECQISEISEISDNCQR